MSRISDEQSISKMREMSDALCLDPCHDRSEYIAQLVRGEFFQPNRQNQCWQCTFLQTTDMLKRYISVCISLCLFRFNFQSYSALPHRKNDHIGQLGKQDIMSYIDVSWHGTLVAISIITGAKEEVRRGNIKGGKCV